MRRVVNTTFGTGALVLALLGGAGLANAQVANHGVVSGTERNLEQHPETGGATTYPGSARWRSYNFDRVDRDIPPADWR